MRKLTIAGAATIILVAFASDSAAAQRPGGMRGNRGFQGGGQMRIGMRGAGANGVFKPGLLLQRSEALELNDEQIAALTDLHEGLEAAGREAREDHMERRRRMAELLQADPPDLDAIRGEFTQAYAAIGEGQWARIEAGLNARSVLTEQQRGRVQGWMQARGGVGTGRMRRQTGGSRSRRGMRRGNAVRGMRHGPRWR